MEMIEKIKKNWKVITIVILCFFVLRGCVTQCNRTAQITKDQKVILMQDSIIRSLKDTIASKDYLIEKQNLLLVEQNKTIDRLDRAASKSITVKPAAVIIKKEDIINEQKDTL